MTSHIISPDTPLPTVVLQQIATGGFLDEISNVAGAVRSHIFWHGKRHTITGQLRSPMLFVVYETTRYGPQNGFRLCFIHQGFYVASETKTDGDPEDDIDRLEMTILQGHMEVVVLGDSPADIGGEDDGGN